MRLLAALLLFCFAAPAQRLDCAPFRLSLPGPSQGWTEVVPYGFGYALHVVARADAPLLSSASAGTIPVKFNMLRWTVIGDSVEGDAGLWAHFTPRYLPTERPHEGDFSGDGITSFGPGGRMFAGDDRCSGFGLSPALGGLITWPCDWVSSDSLRGRDVVIDAQGMPDQVGRLRLSPWWGGKWVEAWFEVVP